MLAFDRITLPCSQRQTHQFNGVENKFFHVCRNPDAEAHGTQVQQCVCEACPVRGLVQQYRKLWPDCDKRTRRTRTEPCGCPYTLSICEHPESPNNGKQVFPKDCRACPLSKQVEVQ